jgi:hypothetical protein
MFTTPKLHNIFLFPSNKGDEPLATASIGKAVGRLCKQYSIAHFSPRDLRRTWKTISGMAGIDKSIRDKIQNHSDKDISSIHYDRYDYLKEKRAAMDVWNDYLKNIIEGKTVAIKEEVSSLEVMTVNQSNLKKYTCLIPIDMLVCYFFVFNPCNNNESNLNFFTRWLNLRKHPINHGRMCEFNDKFIYYLITPYS